MTNFPIINHVSSSSSHKNWTSRHIKHYSN